MGGTQASAGAGISASVVGHSPLQVFLNVIVAVELGQVDEDPCGTAAVPLPAVAAVADPAAGRAHPVLEERCPRDLCAGAHPPTTAPPA